MQLEREGSRYSWIWKQTAVPSPLLRHFSLACISLAFILTGIQVSLRVSSVLLQHCSVLFEAGDFCKG